MGLLRDSQEEYYTESNYGNYQFVTITSIINGFMVAYVGENKIINKVDRSDVQFHAMRAAQEFSYDIFRSFKSQEIIVPNTLKMILPQDYVNYTKITTSGDDGIERNLYPTGKTSNPFSISQNEDGSYIFDEEGNLVAREESRTWENFKTTGSNDLFNEDVEMETFVVESYGQRYGLDPQHAHINGTFYIDNSTGYIHFGSDMVGKNVILHYVSDGLGTDGEMVVHKFCEEAMYKWIMYAIVSSRSNVPDYIVRRFKKERFAESRKAKIRLSNIKIEEFTQILRGLGKPIK